MCWFQRRGFFGCARIALLRRVRRGLISFYSGESPLSRKCNKRRIVYFYTVSFSCFLRAFGPRHLITVVVALSAQTRLDAANDLSTLADEEKPVPFLSLLKSFLLKLLSFGSLRVSLEPLPVTQPSAPVYAD
jgi:hypothetical protein